MEGFLKEYAARYNHNYDEIIYQYNNLLKDGVKTILNNIIDTKIKMRRDLYKQDMYILANKLAYTNFVNYDEFISKVNIILKENNILNISLKIIDSLRICDLYMFILLAYYIGTFLEDEPGDIKIALKD